MTRSEQEKVASTDDQLESPTAGNLPWFALQVRTRYESVVANFLEGKGYTSFLPTYKCQRRWSDRIKVTEDPLFPSYLFCRFDPQYRLPILKTPGVIQVVGYDRTPVPIDDGEIQAIQILVQSGFPSQPWPFLTVGERVQIESGPLRGLEGILVALKGKHRLVVSVTLLQRSVAVEMDFGLVRSLGMPYVSPTENGTSQRDRLQRATF
jgi:transcription antitermination factor NusG